MDDREASRRPRGDVTSSGNPRRVFAHPAALQGIRQALGPAITRRPARCSTRATCTLSMPSMRTATLVPSPTGASRVPDRKKTLCAKSRISSEQRGPHGTSHVQRCGIRALPTRGGAWKSCSRMWRWGMSLLCLYPPGRLARVGLGVIEQHLASLAARSRSPALRSALQMGTRTQSSCATSLGRDELLRQALWRTGKCKAQGPPGRTGKELVA